MSWLESFLTAGNKSSKQNHGVEMSSLNKLKSHDIKYREQMLEEEWDKLELEREGWRVQMKKFEDKIVNADVLEQKLKDCVQVKEQVMSQLKDLNKSLPKDQRVDYKDIGTKLGEIIQHAKDTVEQCDRNQVLKSDAVTFLQERIRTLEDQLRVPRDGDGDEEPKVKASDLAAAHAKLEQQREFFETQKKRYEDQLSQLDKSLKDLRDEKDQQISELKALQKAGDIPPKDCEKERAEIQDAYENERRDLVAEKERVKLQWETCKTKSDKCTNDLTECKAQTLECENKNRELQKRLKELEKENASLREKHEQHVKEMEEIEQELRENQENKVQQSQLKELKNENETLKGENARLEKGVGQLQAALEALPEECRLKLNLPASA